MSHQNVILPNDRLETLDKGYVIEIRGLRLFRALTKVEWTDLGRELALRRNSNSWLLGDWLMAGGRNLVINTRGRKSSYEGSSMDDAQRITKFSRSHLFRCHRVAAAFAPDMRRMDLPFTAHEEVLRVPEELRSGILTKAQKLEWTADQIREHINTIQVPSSSRVVPIRKQINSYYEHAEVKCPECGHVFPIKGNKMPRRQKLPGASLTGRIGRPPRIKTTH